MTDSISKFFASEIRELKRSEIHPADYNPRSIDPEGKKNLKRSLKKFGVLGGIVVNARTGYTIVGGHQKVLILDESYGFPENDYSLRVEVIDVDEATEKTINIALNNPAVGGTWDYDKMRELIPDIDYKSAGLTEADLSMIGVDFLLQTEQEIQIAGELNDLMAEANELRAQEVAARKEQRQAERAAMAANIDDEEEYGDITPLPPVPDFGAPPQISPEEERQLKIDRMKELKQRVKDQAAEKAQNMDAYIVLSFDNWANKSEFCQRFGINPYDRFTKGELFNEMVERVDI